MRSTDRYAIAIAISLILASFTLSPLTEDRTFLGSSWLLTLLICAAGLILRRTRLPSAAVLGAQLVVYLGFLALTADQLLPGSDADVFQRAEQLFVQAGEHMQTQAAPMQADNGVAFVFIASLGAITILTDVLVVALRKPALGLAPPLTAYLVPAIGLGSDIGVRPFILITVGYLAILLAEGLNRYAGWPRGLSRDTLAGSVQEQAGAVVWRAAVYVTVPAVALTLLAGAATPMLSLSGWGFGDGGNGRGGPLRLTDPTLDLKRNLTLPANRVVLTYKTNKASGQYLRMASLPSFSQAGWQNAQTSIEEGEKLPDPVGLTEPTGKVRRTTIRIGDFSSEYLPLPYVPQSFNAAGKWGYDPNSLVVISSDRASDRNSATKDLDYSVVSRDVQPDAKTLNEIISGDPPDADLTTAVPTDLPQNIKKLTDRVTNDASTPAQKAAAIQSYLRNPDNFTYSTKPRPGSGYQALENFLFKDKSGYCEQFAAAMALMARLEGIPSRVAVGFLPGTKKDGVWTVTARDAHAWPELYFSGYGWVRYEPTPGVQTGTAPDWTIEQSITPDDSTSQAPSDNQPTVQSQPTTHAQQPDTNANNQAAPTAAPFPWKRVLGIGGGGVLLLALLAAPGAIRIGRRRRRIGAGAHRGAPDVADPADRVEAGWVEVRDTIRDLGRRWPTGSPRTIVTEIGGRQSEPVHDALDQLATLVERERYSRTFTDASAAAAVPELVRTIRRGLLANRSRAAKLRITLFPRSVLRRR